MKLPVFNAAPFTILALSLSFAIHPLLPGYASSKSEGTITYKEGAVKLFTNPGKSVEGPSPRVLFEGTYYTVTDAKVGDRMKDGQILRTAPGAKAKIIFENGDQYMVGPGSAYRSEIKGAEQKAPKIELMHGRIRGVISKDGPRSGLTIRTRSATMGVRGTDFTVADLGPVHGTEVAVIRGKVEVKPTIPAAKPVEVKSGYSVDVTPPKAIAQTRKISVADVKPADVVDVRKTSKVELVEIQKETAINPEIQKAVKVSEQTRKTIEKLEKKAVETTLKDIKKEDPKLFAKIQAEKDPSLQLLNSKAVETVFQTAPATPPRRAQKPTRRSLEEIETDAYEKFFKVD